MCEQVPSKRAKKPREFDPAIIDDFERRLQRLETLAHIPVSRSPGPGPGAYSPSPVSGPGPLPPEFEPPEFEPPGSSLRGASALPELGTLPGAGAGPSFEGSGSNSAAGDVPELGRPQYHLGSAKRPVYHGELSMFEDPDGRPSAAASPTHEEASPQVWSEERLRAAARLRHRYADPDDGEAWLDAYFSWASPVYAVVHRPTFLSESSQRDLESGL